MPSIQAPASTNAIRIQGLGELQRAFRVASVAMSKSINEVLDATADPVRFQAQELAVARIPRIGLPWSRMRVGVTRHTAYVAPVERGLKRGFARRQRPNLKPLLLERALLPAFDQNRERIAQDFEEAMADMAKAWAKV